MAFSPEEIGTRTFSQVNAGGVDRVEVADFLAAVAREVHEQQYQLARAHEQIQRLTGEIEAARAEGRGADQVAEIVAMTEDVVTRVKARAETEASAVRADADNYARQVRAEVDALRHQAEIDVEAFRQETVDHANRMRTEAEGALSLMRGEAEDAIRRVHAQVSAELAERAEVVAATERALIERLSGTSMDLHRAIDYLRERQAQATPIPTADEAPAPSTPTAPPVAAEPPPVAAEPPAPTPPPVAPAVDEPAPVSIDLTEPALTDLPPPPASSSAPYSSFAIPGLADETR